MYFNVDFDMVFHVWLIHFEIAQRKSYFAEYLARAYESSRLESSACPKIYILLISSLLYWYRFVYCYLMKIGIDLTSASTFGRRFLYCFEVILEICVFGFYLVGVIFFK